MRKLAVALAALLAVISMAAPAFASAGLPTIATLKAGDHEVTLYNDSPGLRKGANVLTVEIAGVPHGTHVELELVGPQGQKVPVTLQEVEGIGGHGDSHGGGDHGDGAEEAVYHGRGKAVLPTTGTWTVRLHAGEVAETQLDATTSGPNQIFVASTGLLMGGFMLYGAIQRRRQQTPGK